MPRFVYTDGSCLGNPGPGGWAWVVPDGPCESGYDIETTNQRMEITAAFEAVSELSEINEEGSSDQGSCLTVISDSTYVVNCFVQGWWKGWYRRGWRNSQGKPVANRDLWEPFLELALDERRQISFRWVKGHSGDRWNDIVDELAVEASMKARDLLV